MNKRAYQYHISLTMSQQKDGQIPMEDKSIELDFDNHDNIFKIINVLKEKAIFDNTNQSQEFAIGLKMFSEVMLKNRKHPLFVEFAPAFGDFMKKLKSF